MFTTDALKAAAEQYKAHSLTNPKYNYFFRQATVRVQSVLVTGGILYGTYLCMFNESQR